jgi:hypothetical protein
MQELHIEEREAMLKDSMMEATCLAHAKEGDSRGDEDNFGS